MKRKDYFCSSHCYVKLEEIGPISGLICEIITQSQRMQSSIRFSLLVREGGQWHAGPPWWMVRGIWDNACVWNWCGGL